MSTVKVSGSATIRKNTQDYKRWQFLESDGETAVDLSSTTRITLRLKDEEDNSITEFKTDDASPILFMISPLTDGIVELRPKADTFDKITSYIFHFILTDASGDHPIPEDHNERLTVIDNYPPSP